jgi:hypothetical protein
MLQIFLEEKMPIYRWQLSKAARSRCIAELNRLKDAGGDFYIPGDFVENFLGLTIRLAGPEASIAYEQPTGTVYYAIRLKMISTRSHFGFEDAVLETEWDHSILMASFHSSKQTKYWQEWLQCSANELLNDRIEKVLRFHYREQAIEGWILFSGSCRIPSYYRDAANVPFNLTLYDHGEQGIPAQGQLWLQRVRQLRRMNSGAGRRTTLYDGPVPCARRSGTSSSRTQVEQKGGDNPLKITL